MATLDTTVHNHERGFLTRGALVRALVADGYRIGVAEGARVLLSPDGAWFRQSDITKAGLDYAEFLSPKS